VFVYFENNYVGPYWSDYILLQRGDELEVLGRIGNGVARSCSSGSTSVEALHWFPDGRLVIDLHRRGEYTCNPSAWDLCMDEAEEQGKPSSVCDGVSDAWQPETHDDHPRMLCAEVDGRFRCSAPPAWYGSNLDAASKPGPVPEGADFEELLSCPPRARTPR
jgi:hypothetical protein